MKVGELKAALEQFDDDMEVLITDGFKGLFYRGSYSLELFEETDGWYVCDIGIGGEETDGWYVCDIGIGGCDEEYEE